MCQRFLLCGVMATSLAWNVVPVCVRAAEWSQPAMRPLPTASQRPLAKGAAFFVDAQQGNDQADGSRKRPWQTVNHALRDRRPGDTVYLRGGTYYEHVVVPVSGAEGQPVTLRGYPGELAVIDGGLPEFYEAGTTAWQPLDGGAPGEFISARSYPQFARRPIVTAFPAAGWEPFHGKEDQRPLVLGHFGDSMVPLHGYRTLTDLRDDSMLWDVDHKFQTDQGVYCGPGLWFNPRTQRIHIRLAHTTLDGLGPRNYRGETDPRKLRLCISGPYGADVLRLNGVRDIVLQDLILRGASGSPLINLSGAERITFDGITCFGGAPGLLAKATSQLTMQNSAFRGLAAPWSSRASMKYRGTPSYRIITQRNKPQNHDWEIAHCEFSDDHDGLWIRYVKNLKFHHNCVDNFNDDGIEVGARKRDHELYIYQNLISRCLLTFTLHEMDVDESPPQVESGSGVYITRNVIDLRRPTFSSPPRQLPAPAVLLNGSVTLCGDHGSPVWPNYFFYHNTVLRPDASWRGYYGFGMGGRATRNTRRRVFNNIFVQLNGNPGLSFASGPDDIVVDGNLHWSVVDGPKFTGDFFAAHRLGPAFRRRPKPDSWMSHDLFEDPRFNRIASSPEAPFDVALRSDSPAINAGVDIPKSWWDPLRKDDSGRPDLGAIPRGQQTWSVGIRGRIRIGSRNPQSSVP